MKRSFRPDEVAERWQCSKRLVYILVQRGDLQGFKIGGKLLRISTEAVEAYEACHRQSSESFSSEAGITQLGENVAKLEESPSVPKIVRLPRKPYEVLPSNTKLPTGRKS